MKRAANIDFGLVLPNDDDQMLHRFSDFSRIRVVNSFEELVDTPFGNGVNALCWRRSLPGDFAEVLAHLPAGDGITPLEDDWLAALPVSAAGRVAIDFMLADQRRLRERDLEPSLDCIHGYRRDEQPGPVATDVFSFHADSATEETDTYLCTYHGPSSEGLPNEAAMRRVDVPETRAALLRLHGGADDAGFLTHLSDHCYDLHYVPLPGARTFSFGLGNLWRIAVAYPGCPVPPCLHRAPETRPGDPPRLLLIS